jgi:hypothetical protein
MSKHEPLTKGEAVKTVKGALRGLERKRSITIQQAALIMKLRRLLSTVNQLPWPIDKIEADRERKRIEKAGGPHMDDLFNPLEIDKPEPKPVAKKPPVRKKKPARKNEDVETGLAVSDAVTNSPEELLSDRPRRNTRVMHFVDTPVTSRRGSRTPRPRRPRHINY